MSKLSLGFSLEETLLPQRVKTDSGENDEEKKSNVYSENKDCNKYPLDSDEWEQAWTNRASAFCHN